MKFYVKVLRIVLVIFFLFLIFNQYSESKKLKTYIGESYYNTINHLYYKVKMIKVYVSDNENYDISLLYSLNGEVQEVEVDLINNPQQLPTLNKYYANLFKAIHGNINILIDIRNDYTNFIDSEVPRDRIIKTCELIEWSIEEIKKTKGNDNNYLSYYKDLYISESKTHKIIVSELKKFLEEEHHIIVN